MLLGNNSWLKASSSLKQALLTLAAVKIQPNLTNQCQSNESLKCAFGGILLTELVKNRLNVKAEEPDRNNNT